MKVLYAIQGTGNGHVCRAREIVPLLKQRADVDVLISGIQSDVSLPFDIQYVLRGLSFIFGKKGGVDLLETYRKTRMKNFFREIAELPVEEYDVVVSDFEPVSAWACQLKSKPCVGLSHQVAVLNKHSPKPKKSDAVGKMVMKAYAPVSRAYGFHFQKFDDNIFTPVIRREVRDAEPTNNGHYTVYLPSYSDRKIIGILETIKGVKWEVFSKHFDDSIRSNNVHTFRLSNDAFIRSMASSQGVLCGAGFETPAEALYLKKKLLVIPMKNQYEQHCNAAALKAIGVPVMKSIKSKHISVLQEWVEGDCVTPVDYADETEYIISKVLDENC